MRCTTGSPSQPGPGRVSLSPNTSRSSTTGGDCTRPWATAPRSKRSPTTAPRRPPRRDQPRGPVQDPLHSPDCLKPNLQGCKDPPVGKTPETDAALCPAMVVPAGQPPQRRTPPNEGGQEDEWAAYVA